MLELVTYLINNLVDQPDQVNITDSVDDTGLVTISISVAPEDMGKVIGRSGKVISAIRELTKIKAIKGGQRVRVVVQEPDTPTASPAPDTAAADATAPAAATTPVRPPATPAPQSPTAPDQTSPVSPSEPEAKSADQPQS